MIMIYIFSPVRFIKELQIFYRFLINLRVILGILGLKGEKGREDRRRGGGGERIGGEGKRKKRE